MGKRQGEVVVGGRGIVPSATPTPPRRPSLFSFQSPTCSTTPPSLTPSASPSLPRPSLPRRASVACARSSSSSCRRPLPPPVPALGQRAVCARLSCSGGARSSAPWATSSSTCTHAPSCPHCGRPTRPHAPMTSPSRRQAATVRAGEGERRGRERPLPRRPRRLYMTLSPPHGYPLSLSADPSHGRLGPTDTRGRNDGMRWLNRCFAA